MEFNKEIIERSLKVWEFDIDNISTEEIRHVPQHEWRIATKEKPLLYVENLQVCIGLYAYGNNFAFAAHINPLVLAKNEYTLDVNGNPSYCNRCQDLLTQLLNYSGEITEPFKIGISYGVTPIAHTEKTMQLVLSGVEEVIKKLNEIGIPAVQLENIYEPEFIIDSLNNCLITPELSKAVMLPH